MLPTNGRNQIVIDHRQSEVETLKMRCEDYLQKRDALKTLRNDLKAIREEHPLYQDLQDLKRKAKALKEEIDREKEIGELIEKIDEQKDSVGLSFELVQAEMQEQQLNLFEYSDTKKFKLIAKLKVARDV